MSALELTRRLFSWSRGRRLFTSWANADISLFCVNSLESLQLVIWVHRCCDHVSLWSLANWCASIKYINKLIKRLKNQDLIKDHEINFQYLMFIRCIHQQTYKDRKDTYTSPKVASIHRLVVKPWYFNPPPLFVCAKQKILTGAGRAACSWYGQRACCTKQPFVC